MFGIGSSLPGVTLSLKYLFYNQIWFSELSSNEVKVVNSCCVWVGGIVVIPNEILICFYKSKTLKQKLHPIFATK